MSEYIEHRIKSKAEKFFKGFFKVLIGGIFFIILVFLFGYITMRLWNWLMPELFGLGEIQYWQALGVLILAKILFGGFGNHKSKRSSKKTHRRCKPGHENGFKKDFSNWKYYDKFWEDQGEKAFEAYVKQKQALDESE
jgi:hypothetical protein